MATLVHPSSSADEPISSHTISNLPDSNGMDGRTWRPKSSSKAKGKACCRTAAWNETPPVSAELQLLLNLEWVEDSSTCSSADEGVYEKFYDKLGPLYKPFPEEEASVAELLRDITFQQESYAVSDRGQDEASAHAASTSVRSLKSPSQPDSSPASVKSPLQNEVSFMEPDLRDVNSSVVQPSRQYFQTPEVFVGKPPLDLECFRPKRKRDRDHGECTTEDRKKLRTHEVGFVTPSAVPAFNWMSPDGFRTIDTFVPSHDNVLRSEVLKYLVDTEEHGTTTECGAGCWCSYGSNVVAGEMRSWRAFKLQHIILERNRLWVSVISPDELRETLRCWHTSLKLDNPSSCTIALHFFQRRVHTYKTMDVVRGLNVIILLAVSLWVAVKLVDNIAKVPEASIMAATAGVPLNLLAHAELALLDSVRWKLVCY